MAVRIGNFTGMDMAVVLRRIALRLEELGMTEAAVSRAATKSPDTIRNWRRRLKGGTAPSASIKNLDAVARVLQVQSTWLQGNGPERVSAEDAAEARDLRAELTEIFEGLDQDDQPVAVALVRALLKPAKLGRRRGAGAKKEPE